MFDMQKVAKTISALRKERNMTQMELADRLGISFQAVSNWERAQTMPDISKLSELSEIFGVTIDELLGNGKNAKVVEKLIREEPVEEELTTEDFLNVAPLVKPKQAEKLFENVKDSLSMEELSMAAPFIPQSTLDQMAVQAAQREKSFDRLSGVLPFISGNALEQCLEHINTDGLNMERLFMAAPLMSRETVDRMAERISREYDVEELVMLAPFMSKETVDRMAERIPKEFGTEDLVMLAPFISTETVDRMSGPVMKGCSIEELVALAPYIKKKKLTEAAAVFIDKEGFSKILPLLPFLDQSLLDDYFRSRWPDRE